MLPIPCDLCNQQVPRQHLDSHKAEECNQRQVHCRACFADMRFCELETHEQQCRMLQPFVMGEQVLNPQRGAQGPVYEPPKGSDTEVYLVLPARVLIDTVNGQSIEILSWKIRLIWNTTEFNARFYHKTTTSLFLDVQQQGFIARASFNVFSDRGELLTAMKTYIFKGQYIFVGSLSNAGIAVFYDTQSILNYQGNYFFIQIKLQ